METIKERLLEAKAIILYNDEIIYVEPENGDDVYGISAGQNEWFLKENYWDYYESEMMMSYLHHITVDEAMQIIESWGIGKVVDEPNATTYAAMEAVEKGKDMSGPFDNMDDLMEELDVSEYPCVTDGNT